MLQPSLTREQKSKWLLALKSGKYIQAKGKFREFKAGGGGPILRHCCLAVLSEVIDTPSNKYDGCISPAYNEEFGDLLGGDRIVQKLMIANDDDRNLTRDYSSVIPLIEAIPVKSTILERIKDWFIKFDNKYTFLISKN